jgi:hypothetical protein
MKKLLSILIALVSAQATHAQATIKAGTVQLGGSIGYFQTKTEAPYSFNAGNGETITTQHADFKTFNVTPSVGYFIADNLAIGILANYGKSSAINSYDTQYIGNEFQNSKQLSIGGFAKYYKMLSEQFGIAGLLGISYFHTAMDFANQYQHGEQTSKGEEASITPSIVFFPIPRFAIGASIGSLLYSHQKTDLGNRTINGYSSPYPDNTLTSSSFGAKFGLDQLAFSGTYYFGR